MLRVGLTGGIGSGKTTVARIFESLGIPVYNADEAAKRIMVESPAIREAITEKFGPESYTNGELNRAHLSKIVFSDKEKIDWLNALVHPATIENATKWMQQQKAPYVIKEAALLFESGAASELDYIIGVTAPAALRIQRVIKRDQSDPSQVKKRIDLQLEESLKLKLCDFTIVNDETSPLLSQILKIDQELKHLAANPKPAEFSPNPL
ncbi:MAG: dephospho-CoA kinase [Chitinophagaceae bacterium]|jgi:dephospho-CoA kinase